MDDNQISPETSAKLSSVGKKYFNLIEFDKNEQLIREIRKHPIGLFFIYATGAFIAIICAIVFGIVGFSNALPELLDGSGAGAESVRAITTFTGFIFIVLVLGIMIIQSVLYINNVIFVTNEKIAQILYLNLFNRKISQLSLGDIQDVTVTQKGVLAHIFNYGTLVIDTAGEQQNYTFTFIPDPYSASKVIVGAHEKNLAQFGN